ncbi:diguanylate cyclase [Shewanella basaltis]|uniref:diguanylate cyclase domain-containing protein n=1 Tax=Shewanella basaltis TaxID=472183 RepID=UPI00200E53A6|nr:diguanylate cyclase [Shewanella basaltis]
MKAANKNKYNLLSFMFGLLLLFVAAPALSLPSQELLLSDNIVTKTQLLSVSEQLDVINSINSQKSEDARTLLEALERQQSTQAFSNVETLRLSLLRCFNLLEFGEFNQAIMLAKQGELNARQLKYDSARPYFILCEASAHQSLGNTIQEQRQSEEALRLARRYSEKQAMVNALYLRSRQNTSLENYNQSIEDLRLALDIFDEAQVQFQQWYLLPRSFVQLEISNVFFSMGDIKESLHFAETAANDFSAFGKLKFAFAVNLARINIEIDNKPDVLLYLKKAEAENNKNTATRDIAIGNALLAAINSYLGNNDTAEQQASFSIKVLTQYKEPIYVMRIKRTLAKIYFAQNKDNQALALLNDIIQQASELQQFSDLEEFNHIISEYYAINNQFELAYQFQVQRFEAAKQAAAKLNNAHFVQYQARLAEQNNAAPIEQESTSNINQNIAITALIILLLSIGLVLFLAKKPQTASTDTTEETQQQRIDNLLLSAKQGHYQLSMLLVNISQIRQVDIPYLEKQFQLALREQDQLFRHSLDELVILLPHTSATGATRVMHQIEQILSNWKDDVKASIGLASLQQLDTFEVLMKRAILNQLSKMKTQDSKVLSHEQSAFNP